MRYIKIVFLSDPVVMGYMEIDENGNLLRLTSLEGSTFDVLPDQAYSVINDNPPNPEWAV